jgi:hypothetical protein
LGLSWRFADSFRNNKGIAVEAWGKQAMLALGSVDRHVVEDSIRTALAAVGSFLIARLLHMPEAY